MSLIDNFQNQCVLKTFAKVEWCKQLVVQEDLGNLWMWAKWYQQPRGRTLCLDREKTHQVNKLIFSQPDISPHCCIYSWFSQIDCLQSNWYLFSHLDTCDRRDKQLQGPGSGTSFEQARRHTWLAPRSSKGFSTSTTALGLWGNIDKNSSAILLLP